MRAVCAALAPAPTLRLASMETKALARPRSRSWNRVGQSRLRMSMATRFRVMISLPTPKRTLAMSLTMVPESWSTTVWAARSDPSASSQRPSLSRASPRTA